MTKTFKELLENVAACPTKKVAVAVAQDDAVLEAVAEATTNITKFSKINDLRDKKLTNRYSVNSKEFKFVLFNVE